MVHGAAVRRKVGYLGMALLLGALLGLGDARAASAGPDPAPTQPLRIAEFLPQGRVSGLEAVQLRFAEPAVAFGDADARSPIALKCEGPVPAGQGRWLDDTRWTYVFDTTVPSGVSCVARPNSSFTGLQGRPLFASRSYEFNTGAPSMVQARPYPNVTIDEEQIFILSFNGPVDPAQVAAHSHCVVQGVGEKIPVSPVDEEHRADLLEAAYIAEPEDPAVIALLRCARVLPPEAEMRLEIGPGIRARGQPGEMPGSEKPQVLEYEVRPSFTAKLSCTRERAGRPCLPITPISVTFSAPVARAALEGVRLHHGETEFNPDPLDEGDEFASYLNFPGPFPANSTLTLSLPDDVHDDAGRPLENASRFPLQFPVADYPPLAKFASGEFGVIERFAHGMPGTDAARQQAAVPVTLRHIEADPVLHAAGWSAGQVANLRSVDDAEVLSWYSRLQRLQSGQWSAAQVGDIVAGRAPREDYGRDVIRMDARSVSLLNNEASARRLSLPGAPAPGQRPFEVVGVPLDEPGFHVLEVESKKLGASLLEDGEPMYVRTGVLLTNLSVHVKQGSDDLLVWVTTLADAQPVADAEIAVLDCNGGQIVRGRSDATGIWHHLAAIESPSYCRSTGLEGLFVSARIPADHPQAHGAADYSFVMSGWDRGIESWRFNVPTSRVTSSDVLTHTVFDRSLFRAGETVSMKHFLREETRDGLRVPKGARPDRVVIEHEGSSQKHELSLTWQGTSSGGLSATSEFSIPESAHLGSYVLRLTDEDGGWYGSASFRVEEFRLPMLSGQLAVRGAERPDVLVAPDKLSVDIQLSWLSGGAAAGQRVSLSAVAEDRWASIDGHDGYSFRAPPRERTGEQNADHADASDESDGGPRRQLFVDNQELLLDANGMATVDVAALPSGERPQRFLFEASFADPNGEIQTLSRSVDVWPSLVQAGLKVESWNRAGEEVPVGMLALDVNGKPREGVAMRLLAVERKLYTVRKRMVGGFYRYDSHSERSEPSTVCEGVTDASGSLGCTASFDDSGSYELIAVAEDEQGRPSQAFASLWVSGAGELWFGGEDDDRIDLIPLKREWAAGEHAEFQVRMPFREALALVTVEREGVLWTDQVKLQGKKPVVRIPVSASWGPNAYVSVLVLRGRLYELPWQSFIDWGWRRPASWVKAWAQNPDDALITSRIDLAKPAFRLGIAEIQVGGEADRLQVEVIPETEVVQPREDVVVRIRARLPDGSPAAHGSVAFAAVDEALLELSPNGSWDLYEAMHPRRSLSVHTATSQLEVVGRRHYGRKAVAAGGGGGNMPTRQLFDTLLSWQPMVELDAKGEAQLRIRMNDSLSRFRLVAVADHGQGLFGTAAASVVSRQDLQLVSGLPPVVREADSYLASVTLRNGTDEERNIEVKAIVSQDGVEHSLPARTLRLAAGGSGQVSWPVDAPALPWPQEHDVLDWKFEAGDDSVADKVALSQRLVPRQPTVTVQAGLLGVMAGEIVDVPVAAPNAAMRNVDGQAFGGIALDVASSLVGSLEGVRDWWRAYPYTCLEQTASQAIALQDSDRWRKVIGRLVTHMDEDGLLRYFPGTAGGSEVLTAYLVAVSDDAQRLGMDFRLPPESLQRMLDGLQAFAEGRIKRDDRRSGASLDSRRIMAMEALARHGRINPGMVASLSLPPEQWPTPSVVDWLSLLVRMPAHANRDADMAAARNILVSRMTVSGAAMTFSDTAINAAPGLMATRVTSLSKLMLAVQELSQWHDDMPRMVQGLISQQKGGRWSITTENLLGGLALAGYAQHFEPRPATGNVQASLDGKADSVVLPPAGDTAITQMDWPRAQATLQLAHQGEGRAWVGMRAQARIQDSTPDGAGYRIERRIVPVQRAAPEVWSRGDVYKVEIDIHSRDTATWVVLDDPVPAGATILGSGLGRDTRIDRDNTAAWDHTPRFIERTASAYRAYFDYLPAGHVRVTYTVRLNAVGTFGLPPTRVEALYRPDLFGNFPNPDGMTVGPGRFDVASEE